MLPADVGRLGVERAVAAPAAPEVAVAVDAKAVERALVGGVDQLGLVAEQAAVGADVVAPDAAIRRAFPLDDVELLLVGRERQAVRVDQVGDHGRELAVAADAVDVGRRLLGLRARAFPLAVDAEQRVGEPDAVVGLDDDVVRRVQALALEAARRAPSILPSFSVRVMRRVTECSQVTSRPWRSRVLPLA